MHTFSFYSVSPAVADALRERFSSSIEGDLIKAKTPLGYVTLQYDYNQPSGQLTISVVDKPFAVTNGMIETNLRDEINTIAAAIESKAKTPGYPVPVAPVAPPVATPPLPVVAPESIPEKTEVAQTVAVEPPVQTV